MQDIHNISIYLGITIMGNGILTECIHLSGNGLKESRNMSLFCICAVADKNLKKNAGLKQKVIDELETFAEQYDDLGVLFTTMDMDGYITDAPGYKDALKFYIADSKRYYNCEHLFRPDWCNEEEKDEYGTLEYRMTKLKALLECVLKYCDWLEIFIGEFGEDFEKMYTRVCSIESFKYILLNEYERNCFYAPSIHLIVER